MIEHFNGENFKINVKEKINNDFDNIEKKYREGDYRLITEQGILKLPDIPYKFKNDTKYDIKPGFQRRLRWNDEKKSKLIESIIMNVPIPPVFLYEKNFGEYEVMDGLQRISTIIDFYNNIFKLKGLKKWSELNGLSYSELPQIIKDGIDRRSMLTITLLNESAKSPEDAIKIKNMVFERLNTGGVKLNPQEIRNAIYDGKLNKLCIELASLSVFKKLWEINENIVEEYEEEYYKHINESEDKLYVSMSDIEQVLKFFAFRFLDQYNIKLENFLNKFLEYGNSLEDSILGKYRDIFKNVMEVSDKLFGIYSFKVYRNKKWSEPVRTIADPLLYTISANIDFFENVDLDKQNKRIKEFREFYESNAINFDGKKQSKKEIKNRIELFKEFFALLKEKELL